MEPPPSCPATKASTGWGTRAIRWRSPSTSTDPGSETWTGGTTTLPETMSVTGRKTEGASEMREARYYAKTRDVVPSPHEMEERRCRMPLDPKVRELLNLRPHAPPVGTVPVEVMRVEAPS